MWRRLRIVILLLILLFVALNTYFDRVYSTDWNIPLRVAAYPINADGRLATQQYIRQLPNDALQGIETFFEQEAKEYGLQMERPIRMTLLPTLAQAAASARSARRQAWHSAVEFANAVLGMARRLRRRAPRRTSSCSSCITILRSRPRSRIRWGCRKDCSESCTCSRTPA